MRNFKKKEGFECQILNYKKDKTPYWNKIVCQPFYEDGIQTGYMAIQRDVSEEQYRKEELEATLLKAIESDKSKNDFVAHMSHELRTPLNAIIGFSEMMYYMKLSKDKIDEYSKLIHDSGKHLLSILNDIIEVSRVESVGVDLHKENVKVSNLILECFSIIEGKANNKNIKISKSSTFNPEQLVFADKRRLKQCFLNILTNAIKYSPNDSLINYEFTDNNHNFLFIFQDFGSGIPEKDIENIFKPFFQVKKDSMIASDGTGLGLTITKNIIEAHGGNIDIKSMVDIGTTVTLSLPKENAIII